MPTCAKDVKVALFLRTHTEVSSKWIVFLHVRAKTIKLLEENTGVNLCDFGLGHGFLGLTLKTQSTEGKKRNWT